MKKFCVSEKVFEHMPTYCIGVLVAGGIDNAQSCSAITEMLEEQIESFVERFDSVNIREIQNIKAFRDAFIKLGMNPNKFMCSIEALAKRVQKNGQLPSINSLVDLGNAFSLKYVLPIGAHDIDNMERDFEVRFSNDLDLFQGMDQSQSEAMPEDELVYVSAHQVKTRRWIWRQSEDGKITENTTNIFIPIDGFSDINKESVLQAQDELAHFLESQFGVVVKTGLIDIEQPEMELL